MLIELHFLKEVKPGYFWLFPAGNGIANIGIGLSKTDAKKETRTKQNKFGRSAKSVGGSGRCRVGKGRQMKKAEREQAEQQTGESKR